MIINKIKLKFKFIRIIYNIIYIYYNKMDKYILFNDDYYKNISLANESLRAEINVYKLEKIHFNNRYNDLMDKNHKLNLINNELEKKYNKLKTDYLELQNEVTTFKNKTNEIEKLKQNNITLKNINTEQEEKYSLLLEQFKTLYYEQLLVDNLNTDYKTKYNELSEKYNNLLNNNNKLSIENDKMISCLNYIQKELS